MGQSVQYKTIPLSASVDRSVTPQEYTIPGDSLFVDSYKGPIEFYLQLNDTQADKIPLSRVSSINSEFEKFYISNNAGTGSVNLRVCKGLTLAPAYFPAYPTPASFIKKGFVLTETQQLVYFGIVFSSVASYFPWVAAPLAVGGMAHLKNLADGQDMPYEVPKGYKLTAIADTWTFDKNAEIWIYIDGQLSTCTGFSQGRTIEYIEEIVPLSTSVIDATGATSHTVDVQVTNDDLAATMSGAMTYYGILEAIATPPFPKVKRVKCTQCGTVNEVDVKATVIKCSACGKTLWLFNTASLRGV